MVPSSRMLLRHTGQLEFDAVSTHLLHHTSWLAQPRRWSGNACYQTLWGGLRASHFITDRNFAAQSSNDVS